MAPIVVFVLAIVTSANARTSPAGRGLFGTLLDESVAAPRHLREFLAPAEVAQLNAMVDNLPTGAWWPCSAAGPGGKECALLEVRPVVHSALGRLGEMFIVDTDVTELPVVRYPRGTARVVPQVDRLPDGQIPDFSLVVQLSGHGSMRYPELPLMPGDLLSWRNTDEQGGPLAETAPTVERLPMGDSASIVAIELPLLLGTLGGASSRALPLHFSEGAVVMPPPTGVACAGSVTIADAASYAAAATCTTIAGSLTLLPSFSGREIVLPLLSSVGGGIDLLGNAQLTSVDLSTLGSLGGGFFVGFNPRLSSLNVPLLGSVGGSVDVRSNANLLCAGFFALSSVGSRLEVQTLFGTCGDPACLQAPVGPSCPSPPPPPSGGVSFGRSKLLDQLDSLADVAAVLVAYLRPLSFLG